MDQGRGGQKDQGVYGRQGKGDRQQVDRALLENIEIPVHLPEPCRGRTGALREHQFLRRILQLAEKAPDDKQDTEGTLR